MPNKSAKRDLLEQESLLVWIEQERFETCLKDDSRTGYETGPRK